MAKRAVDIGCALVLLPLALPVIALAALTTAIVYRAWPFFVQPRVGRGGRTFALVKVRTLDPSTPVDADKYELEHHRPGALCRFLRGHHVDELPQLVHVLTGRMSMVGPRPEMPVLHATFPPDFAAERTSVRPGITGLWQISVAVQGLIREAPEYDRCYVEAQSLRLDGWILWRTASRLMGRPPIASLADVPPNLRPVAPRPSVDQAAA